jgi:hypothetical protein
MLRLHCLVRFCPLACQVLSTHKNRFAPASGLIWQQEKTGNLLMPNKYKYIFLIVIIVLLLLITVYVVYDRKIQAIEQTIRKQPP